MRAPATRDQADAYRYGLRRLDAALVRGDPVPLHEQIRSQRRAALAGVLLGLLGVVGVAVYAWAVPAPDWRRNTLVVGAGSGAMYVVAHHPDRLVPVANLAAGRLVLAALRRGGATEADPATATPVLVPDADLDGGPRTATAAVPGAVAVWPDGSGVAPRWAVCDVVAADGTLVATTVIGGAAPSAPLPPEERVLLAAPDGSTWLVAGGRRHRVDTGDGGLMVALGLRNEVPRAASAGLVSLLPEGPVLATPHVPQRGEPAPGELPGRIGDVLVAERVDGRAQYFVVLASGLQEVPEPVAELLRVASGAHAVVPVGADVLARATFVEELPVAGWPAAAPPLRGAAEAPALCWTWAADGDPYGAAWFGAGLPVASGTAPVALAQADDAGEDIDAVAVGPGGPVRATGPGRTPGAGPLWLVSATGVAHGVADDATAAALGITAADRVVDVLGPG